MEIHQLADGSVIRVVLRGEMDTQSGEQVLAALDQLLDENPNRDLEIHSGGIGYLGTIGSAYIVALAVRVHKVGRLLTFVDLPPQLQPVFEMMNEANLFRIRSTESGCE